ncbi:hypothetical protein NW752_007433 [Fusarium irregulare]|nr:hypothetical protein NW752_007433 [Fusarium irregulare]
MAEEYDIIDSDDEIQILDDVRRSGVDAGANCRFLPGDEVFRSGDTTKYLVGKVESGKYQLADENGKVVHGGKFFEERDLTKYNATVSISS